MNEIIIKWNIEHCLVNYTQAKSESYIQFWHIYCVYFYEHKFKFKNGHFCNLISDLNATMATQSYKQSISILSNEPFCKVENQCSTRKANGWGFIFIIYTVILITQC